MRAMIGFHENNIRINFSLVSWECLFDSDFIIVRTQAEQRNGNSQDLIDRSKVAIVRVHSGIPVHASREIMIEIIQRLCVQCFLNVDAPTFRSSLENGL